MEEEAAGEEKRNVTKKELRDEQGEHVERWRECKAGEKKSETQEGEMKGGKHPWKISMQSEG